MHFFPPQVIIDMMGWIWIMASERIYGATVTVLIGKNTVQYGTENKLG